MAITLDTEALLTKEEALLELDVGENEADKIDLLNLLINRVTALVESWLDRRIVSRGAASPMTEYHTMSRLRRPVAELYTLEWPIISVTSAHNDSTRAYAAASLLIENTDFIVSKLAGKLIRIAGSDQGTTAWDTGFREQQLIYDAGYDGAANVPADLRGVGTELLVTKFREITNHHHGLSGIVDDVGNVTRFGAAALSKDMRTVLSRYKRREAYNARTGERDS